MEFEERNKKPVEKGTNLPMVVLLTLVAVVCLLLYVGWQMISDTPSSREDLTNQHKVETAPDISTEKIEVSEEELKAEVVDLPEELPTEIIEEKTNEELPAEQPANVVTEEFTTHTVDKSETFFSIASRYGLSVSQLKSSNPNFDESSLKAGSTKLKIPIKAIHTVGPGDILRVVAGKYGITVESLMKANNKTKNFAERGEKLIIPLK